jgi:hypothetical protein
MKPDPLVPLAAAAGGAAGFLICRWLISFGFYGLILPGALLGLAAGLVPARWTGWPYITAAAALALGLFTEWHSRPFVADPSPGYFLANLYQLNPVTWLMLLVGTALGFYGPYSQYRRNPRPAPRA